MITQLIYFRKTKHVDELESGSRGLCPYCGTAKMTVKASKYRVKFASLMPGQNHSSDFCRKQENRTVNYEPRKSNSESLFSVILSRPEIEKPADEGSEKKVSETDEIPAVEDPERETTSEAPTGNDDEEKLSQEQPRNRLKLIRQDRKINSLKTIWQANIRSLGYDYLYGTEKLGEVVTFPEFAGRFFADNTGEGQHVYFCRFLGCVDRSFALIFRIFWKDGENNSSRLLVLRCEEEYETLYDAFFGQFQEPYEDEKTHGVRWRAKKNQPDLLIAGDFELVQFPHCREYCFMACNECPTKKMLVSYLRNKQQIYACVGSGRKKRIVQKDDK